MPVREAACSRARGLLALAVAFSAGIHAALVPEHLDEMPPLGYTFIAAAALGAALASALITRPEGDRLPALAALFLVGELIVWLLFVSVRVPGFAKTPEPIESVALLCKASELLGLALALRLLSTVSGRASSRALARFSWAPKPRPAKAGDGATARQAPGGSRSG